MGDAAKALGGWVTFAGCVLVVAVLYWAQAVIVPIALALLLTFVLTPPVTWLQRWIGRVPAVVVLVVLLSGALGLASWGVAKELAAVADELPDYRANIRQKIADIRGVGSTESVARIQATLEDIRTEIAPSETTRGTKSRPMVVESERVVSLWGFPAWVGPLLAPLSTTGLVAVLAIFMLLERQDLRDRLVGLVGHGRLALTTKALDEAGRRVSRQLLTQSVVNLIFGVGALVGLTLIGVPYALLWAALAAALRFIPYLGPIVGAAAPIFVSLAALKGWAQPLWTIGLFIGLELFTNLVLETVLYAGAVGVSQVALLVAVAFWTWLWGPLGLLLATPLTVCLVVLGKHVPGLEFLGTLMADRPPLSADVAYYQRLLANDQSEAADLIDRHVKTVDAATVYDSLLLPALNYAERDVAEGRLEPEEERAVIDATGELLADTSAWTHGTNGESLRGVAPLTETAGLTVLGYATNGTADELALRMLGQLLVDASVSFDVASTRLLSSELVSLVRERGCRAVCVADLPPSAASKTRYLVKRLRAAVPDLHIVVGRWAPPDLADEDTASLTAAGANHVASLLLDTRDHLLALARPQPPLAPASGSAA